MFCWSKTGLIGYRVVPLFFFDCVFSFNSVLIKCQNQDLGKEIIDLLIIEGLRAKRAYIAFLANFHFLQDQANFWQTDLF